MRLDASGIYAIRNVTNGKIYIGSSIDIFRRRNQHLRALRNNSHYNHYLQRAWNKSCEKNFSFEVLEYVSEENQLLEKEKIWIDKFSNISYNLIEVVEKDLRPSLETRTKIAKALKGKVVTEETKRKMSDANRGKTISEETRQKMSEARKGTTLSEETRQKISKGNQGKIVSEEIRQKISRANKGKVRTEETKRKISNARKGKKLSQAHKDKIGRASRGRKHSNEAIEKMRKAKIGRQHSESTKKKIGEANRNKRNRVIYQNELQLLLF